MKKLLFFLVGLVAFASCRDHKDLFDSDRVKEEAKENFPVKDIDPNQDWNMMTVRTLDVTINAKTGVTYTVKVLTDNPFKTGNDAHILAMAEVKDGTTASLKFDAPLVMEYVYVMRQVGDKDCVVTVATLENDKFIATLGRSNGQRAVSARATNITIDNLPDKEKDFTCPDNATKVTEDNIDKMLKDGSYYVEDEVTTNKINLAEGTKLYVKRGATLTLSMKQFDKGTIIVCEGGELNINAAGDDKYFTLKGSIYNKGTVSISAEEFVMQNKEARLINYGIMLVEAEFEMSAGEFYNGESAQFTVYSTSIKSDSTENANENKSSCTWVNDGYYTCYEFEVSSGYQLQNNCYLYIPGEAGDEIFSLEGSNGKDVIFNNSGFILCQGIAQLDNVTLNLAGRSIFKTQTMEFGNVSVNSSVNEVEEDKPLLWTVEAAYDDDEANLIMSGITSVTCKNNFFEPWSVEGYVQLVNAIVSDVQGCNPDYEEKEPDTELTTEVFTYVYEDITTKAGDYDFNDVVLYVSAPMGDEITVTLVAAGASNNLWIKYDFGSNYKGELFGGKEVHQVMGQPEGTLINTNGSLSVKTQEWTIDELPDDFKLTNNGDIYIVDKYGNEVHPFVEKGGVPFALRIPGKWDFPKERTLIDKKYPEFGEWGSSYKEKGDWYKYPAF